MERRQFLKSASVAVTVGISGIAGCTEPGGGEDGTAIQSPEETTTETPTGTPTESPTNATTTTTKTRDAPQVTTHYEFGGKVAGWQGREPQKIADTANPTLTLEAGKKYKVTWENLDGAPHNFAIHDSNGNKITSTKTISNKGSTLSLTFTATQKMAQYICTIHPTTMVGNIKISSM